MVLLQSHTEDGWTAKAARTRLADAEQRIDNLRKAVEAGADAELVAE